MQKILIFFVILIGLNGCAGTLDNAIQTNFLGVSIVTNNYTNSTVTSVAKPKIKGM